MRTDLLSRTLLRFFATHVGPLRTGLTHVCVLMGTVLCAFLLFAPAAQAQSGDIIYVDADVGGGPGDSWDTAFSDLNNALEEASGSDVIVIAAGTYTPGTDRSDSFTITGDQDGLKVYGGWDGTESFADISDVESQLDGRDLAANKTVLSGDIDDNDYPFNPNVESDNDSRTPTVTDHIRGGNSKTIWVLDGRSTEDGGQGPITRSTVLDRVTITGGLADDDEQVVSAGGGMRCRANGAECSPTLSNVIFKGNRAAEGGALAFSFDPFGSTSDAESSPRIINSVFYANSTGVQVSSSFRDFNGSWGGAIAFGGVLLGKGSRADIDISGSVFADNVSFSHGGAIYMPGFANSSADVAVDIRGTTFAGNKNGWGENDRQGRAIQTTDAEVILTNCIVESAPPSSGRFVDFKALQSREGSFTLSHTLIEHGPGDIEGSTNYLDENGTPVSFDQSTNLSGDPQFLRADAPDGGTGTFGTDLDGLRLLEDSPALNAGLNDSVSVSTDLTGASRIQDGTVDLGAYEGPTQPQIIYVDADAPDGGDGTSWETAFNTPKDALGAAGPGSEIWIAEGVYTPEEDDPSGWLQIGGDMDGIQFYGGFAGNETRRSQRDPREHRSILSGDVDNDDTDPDGDGIIEDYTDVNGTNVEVFRFDLENEFDDLNEDSITPLTVIDGLVITAGGDENNTFLGAGVGCEIENVGVCSPTLNDLLFAGNSGRVGGAVGFNFRQESTGQPAITNSVFVGNYSDLQGGSGVSIQVIGESNNAFLQITNTLFIDNHTGADGGAVNAIFNSGSSRVQLNNTTFVGNTANENGGAVTVRASQDPVDVSVVNTLFWDNRADANEDSSGSGDHISDETADEDPAMTVTHTLVEGGDSGITGNPAYLDDSGTDASFDGSTNLDADPQFVEAGDPAGPDGRFATADDGLRVRPGSPVLDAGIADSVTTATDLLGTDRIQDNDGDGTAAVDLGVYEGAGLITPVVEAIRPTTARPGDTLTVRGVGLKQVTGAAVGGAAASDVIAGSPGELGVVVPEGAASGPVEVTNPKGTGSSPQAFRPSPVPYGSGPALALDGDGDYVSADAASDEIAEADAVTMEAWAHPEGGSDQEAILAFNTPDGGNKNILFYENERFRYYDETTDFQPSADPFSTGMWHHVAVVLESGGEGTLYVNGTEQATFTTDERPADGGRFSIGQEWDDDTTGDFFAGQIDEVRLWDTARTADEIRQSMHQTIGTPASAPGLVGYWRFDTGEETAATSDAYDWAGPSIGTLEGDAERTAAPGAPLGQTATLVSGGASQTVGPDGGTVHVDNQGSPDTDTLTVYQYGAADANLVEAGAPGEDFDATGVTQRLNVTWGIEPVAGSSASSDVTFDFSGLAGINDPGAVLLLKREGPGQPWQDVTGQWTLDAEAQTFSRSGVSSFSEYAIAGDEQALPVELAGFDAQRSGDEAITVQWETLSETNNAGFEVQRRTVSDAASKSNVETSRRDVSTGESWETVARLDGAGTTDEPQSYRFEDTDLPYEADSLRYRLRQVDTDGTKSFSEAVTIGRRVTEAELLPTYPNPTRSQATVRFAVTDRQDVRIVLYDMLGRRVQTVVATDAEGRTEAQLDVNDLASGTYFLRMQTEDGPVDTQRVTVVR